MNVKTNDDFSQTFSLKTFLMDNTRKEFQFTKNHKHKQKWHLISQLGVLEVGQKRVQYNFEKHQNKMIRSCWSFGWISPRYSEGQNPNSRYQKWKCHVQGDI